MENSFTFIANKLIAQATLRLHVKSYWESSLAVIAHSFAAWVMPDLLELWTRLFFKCLVYHSWRWSLSPRRAPCARCRSRIFSAVELLSSLCGGLRSAAPLALNSGRLVSATLRWRMAFSSRFFMNRAGPTTMSPRGVSPRRAELIDNECRYNTFFGKQWLVHILDLMTGGNWSELETKLNLQSVWLVINLDTVGDCFVPLWDFTLKYRTYVWIVENRKTKRAYATFHVFRHYRKSLLSCYLVALRAAWAKLSYERHLCNF